MQGTPKVKISAEDQGGVEVAFHLGSGGMARVYADAEKKLAVKIADDRCWMLSECACLARLRDSKFVVPLLATDVDRAAVVMPLARTTLAGLELGGGPLREALFRAWAWQLFRAIDDAHEAGIVHRDIKPSNVLVSDSGNLWLADWNSASFAPTYAEGDLRDRNLDCGVCTVYTRPPETLGEFPVSHLSKGDVWSAAMTLCYVFAGSSAMDFLLFSTNEVAAFSEAFYMYRLAIELGLPPSFGWEGMEHLENMSTEQRAANIARLIGRTDSRENSEYLFDFLACALDVDPRTRPSAANMLRHPFLSGCSDEWSGRTASMFARDFPRTRTRTEPLDRPFRLDAIKLQSPLLARLVRGVVRKGNDDVTKRTYVLEQIRQEIDITKRQAAILAETISLFLPGSSVEDPDPDWGFCARFLEENGFDVGELAIWK